MRFSVITRKADYCRRIEDAGHKCRKGEFPRWADAVVTFDGMPGDTAGVNSGLLAKAIHNDPTYLGTLASSFPEEDSIVLVSEGVTLATLRVSYEKKLIPLGLGGELRFAVVTMRRAEEEAGSIVGIPSGKLILRVTLRGRSVELVDTPAEWACLMELFSLENLLTLPRRILSPKNYAAGAWVVLAEEPEVPEEAVKHVLSSTDSLVVSARGISVKEVKRRVQRSIERLGLGNSIHRKDLLLRR